MPRSEDKRRKRRKLRDRDGDGCFYCGVELVEPGPDIPPLETADVAYATIEHLRPVGWGGHKTDVRNMVLSCVWCQIKRHGMEGSK